MRYCIFLLFLCLWYASALVLSPVQQLLLEFHLVPPPSHPKSVAVISMFFVKAASSVSERYAVLAACRVTIRS